MQDIVERDTPPSHRVIKWNEVDFSPENSTPVVSGAMKYILPVPEDKGEALVYPETVTDVKGQVHSIGDPITDYKGNPLEGKGVVVYNSSEKIYQAGIGGKEGDARGVIIINHVTEEKAARLDQLVNSLTDNHPEKLTFDQFKQVEQFARTELGLTNMYDSNVKFVNGNMQDPFTGKGGDEVSPVGFKKRDARDRVQAVFVDGPAELHRPDGTPLPIGDEGAVVLKQGDGVRVITKADFEATYRSAEGFQPIAPDAVKPAVIVNTAARAIPARATIATSPGTPAQGTPEASTPPAPPTTEKPAAVKVNEPTATAAKPSAPTQAAPETPPAGIKTVGGAGDVHPTGHIPDQPVHKPHTGTTIPSSLTTASKAAAGAHIATGAAGIGLGTVGLVNSIEQGDTGGAVIAGSNVASGAAHSTVQVLESAGNTIAPALKGGLAKANIVVTVVDGAYQIYKEDGAEHKLQRAGAVAATTGAAMGTGAVLTGGLTIGGAAATGAAGVATAVAAPVVVAAGAAVAAGVAADTIIDTTRTYAIADNSFKPSANHRNILAVQGQLAGRMTELGATRAPNGKIDLANSDNLSILGQALEERTSALRQFIRNNTPGLPRWIQFTDSQADKRMRYEEAKLDLRVCESAMKELPGYTNEVARQERHRIAALTQKTIEDEPALRHTLSRMTESTSADVRPPATTMSNAISPKSR